MSPGPYLDRVVAFIKANRIQFVDDDDRASKHYLNTLPWVDPRSLIFAPSVEFEDVARDAILLKLAGISEPTEEDLARVQSAFMRAKMRVSREFVVELLKEVRR